ncbi:MAG: ASCH domain-containing protein [Minisyncoccia bacterium]
MEKPLKNMHLNAEPFGRISNRTQSVEVRINDEKRKALRIGDEIEFELRGNPERRFVAKVVELLHFKTFKELYESKPVGDFGGESVERLLESIYKIYTTEEEEKFGVVGVKIELI